MMRLPRTTMNRRTVVALLVAGLAVSGCAQTEAESASHAQPAKVEPISGSDLSRLTLTAQAAKRTGIQTTAVRDTQASGQPRTVVPYAAVLYDAHGDTWVYTSPEPLTFVRAKVVVDRIEGDQAVLRSGPAAGTAVVTVGAAELYGTEYEVGH